MHDFFKISKWNDACKKKCRNVVIQITEYSIQLPDSRVPNINLTI